MQKIPFDVLDRCRTFLEQEEIYTSRRVCKEWNDISNLRMCLIVAEDIPLPPDGVDLSHVDDLILEIGNSEENNQKMLGIVQRCVPGVRFLDFMIDVPNAFNFSSLPLFPQAQRLSIFNYGPMQNFNTLLRATPRISFLLLRHTFTDFALQDVDFALIPNLEILHCQFGRFSFKNCTSVCLRKIICSEETIGDLNHLIGLQNESELDAKFNIIKFNLQHKYSAKIFFAGAYQRLSVRIFVDSKKVILESISFSNTIPGRFEVGKMESLLMKIECIRPVMKFSRQIVAKSARFSLAYKKNIELKVIALLAILGLNGTIFPGVMWELLLEC